MVGIRGKSFSVAELAEAGVRRISLATSLYRAAMTGLAAAAREIRDSGTFGYLDDSMSSAEFAQVPQGRQMKFVECEPRRHSAAILAIFNEAIANSTAIYEYVPLKARLHGDGGSRPRRRAATR